MQQDFSKIPSMDSLLRELKDETSRLDPIYIKQLLGNLLLEMKGNPARYKILNKSRQEISQFIKDEIKNTINQFLSPSFKHVINATGVILHTGLGRAPLNTHVIKEAETAAGYTNLEIQLKSGKRGQRLDHIEKHLNLLTGADGAVVVNNNAAAVLLSLNTLTRRKEVIVSRGELVEIGGSFRMPEVMKASGAKMIEVGATNKTHLSDYEEAITDKTAAILIVHPSNYKIVGFTDKPRPEDILNFSHRHDIPVIFDLGSGAFFDLSPFGFEQEPLVRDVVAKNFDIVTFSGDKLLGGPQAGFIIGKKKYIDKIRKNHLLRALRCDKLSLAIIAATLRHYLHPASISDYNPTLQLFLRSKSEMKKMSELLISSINKQHQDKIKIIEGEGSAGSGAYPVDPIPSISLQIRTPKYSAEILARKLRLNDTPIFGYIDDDIFHLNFLTILKEDISLIGSTLNDIL
jgi:L-seryl-tRNA(Ser) seleniumtransferase